MGAEAESQEVQLNCLYHQPTKMILSLFQPK